jgi:hypothetical protein
MREKLSFPVDNFSILIFSIDYGYLTLYGYLTIP